MNDPGYAPAASFECAGVTAAAVGDGVVALGTADGTVEVVAGERTTVPVAELPADVAVGGRVYALVGGELAAFAVDGPRLWSVEVADAVAVAATPDGSTVAVLTDDELLGFDGDKGVERFAVPRPRADVDAAVSLVGGPDGFVHATWSFVTLLDADGAVREETSLGGAIRSVGLVGDAVVASLRDDRLVGLDATDGERAWEGELAAAALPARGEEELVALAADGPVAVAADGSTRPVAGLPGGELHVAADGALACAVADGTVSVYRQRAGGEALTAEVADPVVDAGAESSLAVTVGNDGDRPVSATVVPEGDGVEVATGEVGVELAPDEETTVEVAVDATDVAAGDAATLRVAADGTELAAADLEVSERSPADALAAEATLATLSDGTARYAVEVRNDGPEPLEGVTVDGSETAATLAPGEAAEAVVEVPHEPGGAAAWSASAADPAHSTRVEATLPAAPVSLAVAGRDDGFADVRAENRGDAPVRDDLVVDGEALTGRVSRRLDLGPGDALVLALRPTADGALSAELQGLDAAATATVEAADVPAAGATEDAGASSSERRRVTAGTGEPMPGADAGGGAGGGPATPDAPGHDLTASRGLSPERPRRSESFVERVTVTNEGDRPAEATRLRVDGEVYALGTLRPGETVERSRRHAVADRGEVVLPSVSVVTAAGEAAAVPERQVPVDRADVVARAVVEAGDPQVARVRVFNRADEPCTVSRVGLRGVGVWQAGMRVGPGEGVEWSEPVEVDGGEPVRTAVEYDLGGRTGRVETLAAVEGDGDGGLDALSLTVDEETQVVGQYGTVVLSVTNEGHDPVRDVGVVAAGEAVSDTIYGGRDEVDALAPGEALEHLVDVRADGPSVEVDVHLSAAVDGEEGVAEVTVGGPVPDAEADWTPATLADWRVEGFDGGGGGPVEFPEHVSTGFGE